MFAAVEFFRGNTDFKGKLYDYFSAPQIISQRVEVPDALPFFWVKIKEHKGKIPFSAAQNIMGRLCDAVIYKNESQFSGDSPFTEFRGKELEQYLLFNSAVNYLKTMGCDPLKQHVTVFDEKALFTEKIEELTFLSNKIQIVTDDTQSYQKVAAGLMKKYGVTLIVSSSFSSAIEESTYIISHKSDMIPIYFKGTLFSGESRRLPFGKVLWGEGVVLPQKYAFLLPDGFDVLRFASALYEKCGAKELSALSFERLLLT